MAANRSGVYLDDKLRERAPNISRHHRANSPLAISDNDDEVHASMKAASSPMRPHPNYVSSPHKLQHDRDMPIAKIDMNIKHAGALSGLNVPREDFLKALNFERFSARNNLLLSAKPAPPQASVDSATEEEVDEEEIVEYSGSEDEDANGEDESSEGEQYPDSHSNIIVQSEGEEQEPFQRVDDMQGEMGGSH